MCLRNVGPTIASVYYRPLYQYCYTLSLRTCGAGARGRGPRRKTRSAASPRNTVCFWYQRDDCVWNSFEVVVLCSWRLLVACVESSGFARWAVWNAREYLSWLFRVKIVSGAVTALFEQRKRFWCGSPGLLCAVRFARMFPFVWNVVWKVVGFRHKHSHSVQ